MDLVPVILRKDVTKRNWPGVGHFEPGEQKMVDPDTRTAMLRTGYFLAPDIVNPTTWTLAEDDEEETQGTKRGET
jgi:hypothetical protein